MTERRIPPYHWWRTVFYLIPAITLYTIVLGAAFAGAEAGAALDTRPWRYRKAVQFARPGPQQVELDLDVLARARPDLADLRLVRDGKQVPYLVERPSLTRSLNPVVAPANDSKQPTLSRWKVTLPRSNLPVSRLECRPRTSLFQRSVRVWEEVPDDRGGRLRRDLGSAEGRRTTDSKDVLTVVMTATPQADALFLETDNGDNPPIELDNWRVTVPVIRLGFKAVEPPLLYYGNPSASAPRYDLSLVAMKLLSADKAIATLGTEEVLRKAAWTEGQPLTGVRGWLFWGILALVVVGLIAVIVRLLPKPPADAPPSACKVELPFKRIPTSEIVTPSMVMSALIHPFSPESSKVATISS